MSKHDDAAKELSLKPSMIGLDNIILSTSEANILTENNKLVGQPDGLMFDPTTKTLYNIEYKCHDSGKQRRTAEYQLRRNGLILQTALFPWTVVDLYIHDNYEVEVIR
jgi:hypothetical protein